MAEIKTKSVKLNMVMNALLSMSSFIFPIDYIPVCVKNPASGRNRKSRFCDRPL